MTGGQSLVEFALVLPVLCLLILGGIEATLLVQAHGRQEHSTQTLADWSAYHFDQTPGQSGYSNGVPGQPWDLALAELLPGCDVPNPTVTDNIITVDSTCHYDPIVMRGLYDGLSMSADGSAALP